MDSAGPAGGSGPIERALACIEARLFETLSLAVLADAAGLSPYHFSRMFLVRQGETVMGYVRRRRLAHAAARLAGDPGARLIDLALDCGFESQEAFTRAFTRTFGVSPGKFRRGARAEPSEQTGYSMTIDLVLQETLERRDAFTVAGLSDRFDGPTRSNIPKLWDRFAPYLRTLGAGESYGVCWASNPDDGSFRYMAGFGLHKGAPAPAGLERLEIPAQTYVVFRQTLSGGPLHPQMKAAADAVWGERLPRSGRKLATAPDFEFYPADFAPDRAGAWVAFYVPIID